MSRFRGVYWLISECHASLLKFLWVFLKSFLDVRCKYITLELLTYLKWLICNFFHKSFTNLFLRCILSDINDFFFQIYAVAHEIIWIFTEIFRKCFENLLMARRTIVMIISVKFKINLETYVEVTRHFIQVFHIKHKDI